MLAIPCMLLTVIVALIAYVCLVQDREIKKLYKNEVFIKEAWKLLQEEIDDWERKSNHDAMLP